MRWKEYFLVPDHRVRTISGASFEGFYYICFNQVEGTVSGIYFHAKSEKSVTLFPAIETCWNCILTFARNLDISSSNSSMSKTMAAHQQLSSAETGNLQP